jgi:hypothetical protein
MSPRRALVGGLALAAVVLAGEGAAAHTRGSTGYASIAIAGTTVRYTLTLWPTALVPAVADDLQLTRRGSSASRDRWLEVIRAKVTIAAQGTRCEAGPGAQQPAARPAASVSFVLEFRCREAVRDLVVRDDLFDVLGADYHTLARIEAGTYTTQFAFTPETREARVGLGGRGGGVGSFIRLGVEHILTGYDHLLFLLALLLPGGSILALGKVITAFTLAHSVTLSLAVLQVVALPERLVEAVIALSIAAVAIENLCGGPTVTRRWMLGFAFGLVHGFGFSSALREVGFPAGSLLLSLVGFNAGVELGQALVVAAALPVMVALRTSGYEQRMVWGSSMAILLVGLVLFVGRLAHPFRM